MIPGGFTPYSCDLSADAKKAFEEAVGSIVGVGYQPVAVASQVVNGVVYSFFCNARVVLPNAPNEAAIIKVYQPREGKAMLLDIQSIKHSDTSFV